MYVNFEKFACVRMISIKQIIPVIMTTYSCKTNSVNENGHL